MYTILSVSYEAELSHRHQLLLEDSGYTVVPAASAASAIALIHSGKIDAILLGSDVPADDRMSVAWLGVTRNLPVVCQCGLQTGGECPGVHVSPSQPDKLLAALEGVIHSRQPGRAAGAGKAT